MRIPDPLDDVDEIVIGVGPVVDARVRCGGDPERCGLSVEIRLPARLHQQATARAGTMILTFESSRTCAPPRGDSPPQSQPEAAYRDGREVAERLQVQVLNSAGFMDRWAVPMQDAGTGRRRG